MPYTRSFLAAVFFACIAIALFVPPSIPFADGAFWYAALLAVLLFLMAATREFFLQFVSLLLAGYYVHRVIVLYFDSGQFTYWRSMSPTPEDVSRALKFLTACFAAILIGWTIARVRLWRRRLPISRNSEIAPAIAIGNYSISFERLFLYYCVIGGSLLVFQIALLFGLGIGAASVVYSRAYGPLYRVSFVMNSIGFLPFLALARRGSPRNIKILAILLIGLQVALALAATSKGTLITIVAFMIICWHFAGRRISRRMVWVGLGAMLLTAFLFFPAMSAARAIVRTVLTDPAGWRGILPALRSSPAEGVWSSSVSHFSLRLGGFDWLLGLMIYGREQFPDFVSTSGDLIRVVNSFVPGGIISVPGYTPVEQLMPMYLRGIPDLETLGGHAEVMAIAGMAYLYYGVLYGPVFFLVWSFVTTKVLRSRVNTIVKILYFQCFVLVMVIAGGFITASERFYEGLLSLTMLVLLDVAVKTLVARAPIPSLRKHVTGAKSLESPYVERQT
jgi:hypothetical protein